VGADGKYAIVVLLDDQRPDVDVSLSVMELPSHRLSGPDMGPGDGLIVIFAMVKQPAAVV